jgi:gas vesicle protein
MVRLVSAALLSIGVVQGVAAQSLGDVARREEERRKAVKSGGKVYTNDELQPVPQPAAPPAASGDQAATAASTPVSGAPASESAASDKAGAKDKAATKDDEKTWRQRMADARDALERSKTFANALQNQLNSLVTDFVNRDDPAQRSVIASQRDKVTAELERVKKEIDAQTKAISDIQEEARRAGVPAGWVR